jgi:GTPase SAR1 family protein
MREAGLLFLRLAGCACAGGWEGANAHQVLIKPSENIIFRIKEPEAVTTISKKVCLLGDFAVGKTSLVRWFVYNRFEEKYLSTIGVHVSRKSLSVPHASGVVDLAILLWGIAGNNGFEKVRASYIRGSAGALLVCDLTRPETLDSLLAYVDLVRSISRRASCEIRCEKTYGSHNHSNNLADS